MPGSNQLPAGAEGAAAFSLIYAIVSLCCSCMLLWLNITHREGWSYICLLAGSTGLSTVASIAQQINDITFYEDVLRGQFARKADVFHNPELAIANGSFGLDLVLYYFQYYSYNVQALFVMFWTGELAQSVYGLNAKPGMQEILRKVNLAGKAISILLPLITILLLRAPIIQRHFVVFLLIADLSLMISLALGSTLMIAILSRYIKTKKSITNWTPAQKPSRSLSNSTPYTDSRSPLNSANAGSRAPTPRKRGMQDRWLMVRFLVSFFILVCFEVTNILFQMQSVKNARTDTKLTQPDLSVGRAKTTFFLFIPGTTAGIFLFIVFGTTAGCRSKMCETFVPRKWRSYNPSKGWAMKWKRRSRLVGSSVPLATIRSVRRGATRPDNFAMMGHDKGAIVVYSRRASYTYHHLMKPLPPLPT